MTKFPAPHSTKQERLNLRAKGITLYHDRQIRTHDNLYQAVEKIVMGSSAKYVYELGEQYGIDLTQRPVEELIQTLHETLTRKGIENPLQLCTKLLRV